MEESCNVTREDKVKILVKAPYSVMKHLFLCSFFLDLVLESLVSFLESSESAAYSVNLDNRKVNLK